MNGSRSLKPCPSIEKIAMPFLIFIGTAALFLAANLRAQTSWTHATNQPVLARGAEGKWDDGAVLWPAVIKDGDTLRMWYAGGDELLGLGTVSLGYAWSLNGLAWYRSAKNPVLAAEAAWEGRSVVCPAVIKEGDTFKMWYGADGVPPRVIGHATSANGLAWEKHATPVLELGASEEWDGSIIGPGAVRKEGEAYKMWYWGGKEAWPLSFIQIGLAISPDGVAWTKYDDAGTTQAPFSRSDPVLQIGASGEWDQLRVWSPAVLATKDGYAMWFAGRSDYTTSPQWVGYATSADGITWRKSPLNPVISARPAWGFSYLTSAVLEFDGYYHLWFTSFPLNNDGQRAEIGYAKSVSDSAALVEIPAGYFLAPNYPNPFQRATLIAYALPARVAVRLEIYDVLGRRIKTLVQRMEEAGLKSAAWEGTDESGKRVSVGIYFYRLRAGEFVQSRKLLRAE
jgi:hypothetical protein